MRVWKKLAVLAAAASLAALLLLTTACPSPPPASTTSPPSTTPSIFATTPVQGGPATGNLNLYGVDPFTLDPAAATEANSHEYILQIFSGLVALDDYLNPVPDIAAGWGKDSTGKVYTFTLRRGVRFHDGREVTAADFKYSWERAALPATRSPTALTYLGDIVGMEEMATGKATELSGVRVIDDYTLEVTITAPRPYFLYKLGYPASFVVDRNNVTKGREWWRQPNGTGPFKLQRWTQGQSLILSANADFYGERARVATVTFKLLAGVPMRMYETGEIDTTGVSMDYIDMVQDEEGPYLEELSILPELSFSYIGFNATEPPFDDANVRRAFTLAVDREKLVSLLFKDMVSPAKGILPPGMPGYNEQLQGLDFNVAAAKEAIKASRYGDVSNLPPITITTSGYGASIGNTLEAIIAEWRQNLGVEVRVRQLEPEFFFYNLMEEKDQMFDIGWIADYPHPQDFLEILFRGGEANNWAEYSNPQVNDILDRAGVEPDNAKALALYAQAEELLMNDAACLPLWFGQNYVLVKPYVQGYVPTPMGIVRLNKVAVTR